MVSGCGFNCISLITDDIQALNCHLCIFLVQYLFKSFIHFKKHWVICVLIIEFQEFFIYSLDTASWQMHALQIISSSS